MLSWSATCQGDLSVSSPTHLTASLVPPNPPFLPLNVIDNPWAPRPTAFAGGYHYGMINAPSKQAILCPVYLNWILQNWLLHEYALKNKHVHTNMSWTDGVVHLRTHAHTTEQVVEPFNIVVNTFIFFLAENLGRRAMPLSCLHNMKQWPAAR